MSLFYTNETNTLKNHKEKVGDIMTSLKSFNRRVGSLFAVAGILLATITPGLVPAFASAAEVTTRSVALSSASDTATDVTYEVTFTPATDGAAFVVDFCSDSPLVGASCAAPTGFSAAGVDSATSGYTAVQTTAAATPTAPANHNAVAVTGTLTKGTPVSVELEHIHNPTVAGTVYARIVTYDGGTASDDAAAYTSAAPGTTVDQGSAAFSITDDVNVSGAVKESMIFCVSAEQITTESCATTTTPTLKLGQGTGVNQALDSNNVSQGSLYSQISTNAASGAVVNLKTNTTGCGGLWRAGDAAHACDITAAGTGGINAGDAKFGVEVSSTTSPSGASGAFAAAGGGSPYYSDSVFKLNYVAGDQSGVTGPYGDPLLDTANAPANNKNAQITFGASVSNNTPAGLYSADLSLIATGKF